MTAATFIDSSVLQWLVRTDRRVSQARARLVVVVGPGRIRDMLTLAALDDRLTIVDPT